MSTLLSAQSHRARERQTGDPSPLFCALHNVTAHSSPWLPCTDQRAVRSRRPPQPGLGQGCGAGRVWAPTIHSGFASWFTSPVAGRTGGGGGRPFSAQRGASQLSVPFPECLCHWLGRALLSPSDQEAWRVESSPCLLTFPELQDALGAPGPTPEDHPSLLPPEAKHTFRTHRNDCLSAPTTSISRAFTHSKVIGAISPWRLSSPPRTVGITSWKSDQHRDALWNLAPATVVSLCQVPSVHLHASRDFASAIISPLHLCFGAYDLNKKC